MSQLKEIFETIIQQMRIFVALDESIVRHLGVAFFSRGHVLLEGLPGTGKTTAAKLLAKLLSRSFKRVQFTSDLLPADLLGAHVYQPKSGDLEFIKGPLFTDLVFADEVNRAPPRTQSALLEAMEERQITVEGKTFALSPDFFVVATQNPRELEGTFPMPEAQIDRFLIKLNLTHAEAEAERWIVRATLEGILPLEIGKVESLAFEMRELQAEIAKVRVDPSLVDYAVRLVRKTRAHPSVVQGSSVRGAIGLIKSARVWAASLGRDFVIPDDFKALAPAIISHRIQLSPEALMNQIDSEKLILELLREVEFPT